MFIATGSLIFPAVFEAVLPPSKTRDSDILALSRGSSVITLLLYIQYLIFQLKTHPELFKPADSGCAVEVVPTSTTYISKKSALTCLALSTVAAGYCSDYLVDSVDDVVEATGLSKAFFGLIIIPLVGNAGTNL